MEKRNENISSLISVAITGPESTGKSQLACKLAEHYNTAWVPEYAREYIDMLGREYNFEDIVTIAKQQHENKNIYAEKAQGFLFSDTELIVTKVWSEFKYKKCDPWILDNIKTQKYDLYLLCDIDLPWQTDPQREHPHLRRELFNIYLDELNSYNFPFEIISGLGSQRLMNAVNAINKLIKK